MNLGNSLFRARKKSGLSQEAVAEKLGVSRQTISKWETDETVPDIRQSKRMAVLYKVTLDELIDFDMDVKEIQDIIDSTSEKVEEKIDWTAAWGKRYPILLQYPKTVNVPYYARQLDRLLDELRQAVNDPSTQMIGVLWDGNGLRTLRAGDEREVDRVMADTLPPLYADRAAQTAQVEIAAPMAPDSGLRALLVALTLVTAMFMGCTFNAMNIISEKEDGIEFINRVLPMTARTYVVQKTLVGFAGGAASTLAAAAVCMRVPGARVLPFLLIVALSAYIAALLGLFIGRFSSGLMVGVVYIKITMILFLAPPVVFYLLAPPDSVLFGLSYLLPSSATFYAVMDLLNGQTEHLRPALAALAAHAFVWSAAYRCLRRADG